MEISFQGKRRSRGDVRFHSLFLSRPPIAADGPPLARFFRFPVFLFLRAVDVDGSDELP